MTELTIANILARLVAAFFAIGAVTNWTLPGTFRQNYARWGYPGWFHYVTAVLELAVAIFLFFPSTRVAGAALGVAVMAAAIATLLRHREYSRAVVPAVVLMLTAIAGWMSVSTALISRVGKFCH